MVQQRGGRLSCSMAAPGLPCFSEQMPGVPCVPQTGTLLVLSGLLFFTSRLFASILLLLFFFVVVVVERFFLNY